MNKLFHKLMYFIYPYKEDLLSIRNSIRYRDYNLINYISCIFKKEINDSVISFENISRGYNSNVHKIKTNNGGYIIKFPKYNNLGVIHREYLGFKLLNGIVPIPSVIAKSDLYIIEEYVHGTDLDKAALTRDEEIHIYKCLGNLLHNIHSIKMKGFGRINNDNIGEYSTLDELIYIKLNNRLKYLKNNNILDINSINDISEYINKNKSIVKTNESVLLHSDFGEWNIKINNGEIACILDFGDLSAGPRALDFSRIYTHHYYDDNDNFQYLLQGYGEINFEQVRFFSVLILLQTIKFHHKHGNSKQNLNQKKILMDIIKKS